MGLIQDNPPDPNPTPATPPESPENPTSTVSQQMQAPVVVQPKTEAQGVREERTYRLAIVVLGGVVGIALIIFAALSMVEGALSEGALVFLTGAVTLPLGIFGGMFGINRSQ